MEAGPSRTKRQRNQTAQSDFQEVTARFRLPLAPAFLTRPTNKPRRASLSSGSDEDDEDEGDDDAVEDRSGAGATEAVHQMLSSLVMRYVPSLGGIVLAFSSPPHFTSTGVASNSSAAFVLPSWTPSPFAILNFQVSVLLWKPQVLSRLVGYATPTGSSASHLGLLIHGTFNASIPKEELGGGWTWDPDRPVPEGWKKSAPASGSATPAKVPAAVTDEGKDEEDEAEEGAEVEGDEGVERGCWVNANRDILGGADGRVELTVIKLTIADDMISVTGSLLSPSSIRSRSRAPSVSRTLTLSSAQKKARSEDRRRQQYEDPEVVGPLDSEDDEDDDGDDVPDPSAPQHPSAPRVVTSKSQAPAPPTTTATGKKPRKERSDKGKPRKPKTSSATTAPAEEEEDPSLVLPPPLVFPDLPGLNSVIAGAGDSRGGKGEKQDKKNRHKEEQAGGTEVEAKKHKSGKKRKSEVAAGAGDDATPAGEVGEKKKKRKKDAPVA